MYECAFKNICLNNGKACNDCLEDELDQQIKESEKSLECTPKEKYKLNNWIKRRRRDKR